MIEGITRAMTIAKEQLRREAMAAAHAKLRPVMPDVSTTKGHPTDIGVDAALEAAWAVIGPLREALKDWQLATGQAAVEIVRLKAEVNEHAHDWWTERNAGTISPWRPPYPGLGEYGQPDDGALQQQADMARDDWLGDR